MKTRPFDRYYSDLSRYELSHRSPQPVDSIFNSVRHEVPCIPAERRRLKTETKPNSNATFLSPVTLHVDGNSYVSECNFVVVNRIVGEEEIGYDKIHCFSSPLPGLLSFPFGKRFDVSDCVMVDHVQEVKQKFFFFRFLSIVIIIL